MGISRKGERRKDVDGREDKYFLGLMHLFRKASAPFPQALVKWGTCLPAWPRTPQGWPLQTVFPVVKKVALDRDILA